MSSSRDAVTATLVVQSYVPGDVRSLVSTCQFVGRKSVGFWLGDRLLSVGLCYRFAVPSAGESRSAMTLKCSALTHNRSISMVRRTVDANIALLNTIPSETCLVRTCSSCGTLGQDHSYKSRAVRRSAPAELRQRQAVRRSWLSLRIPKAYTIFVYLLD